MSIRDLIKQGEQIFIDYQKQDAIIDARLLMMHLFNEDYGWILMNQNKTVPEHIKQSYIYLVAKRTQGIPLQYITNSQEFMGLDFYVDERVLIPRQDTETLVEQIIKISKTKPITNAVEIGIGSGCISIALAYYINNLKIIGIDICKKALEVANKNIKMYNYQDRISIINSDVFKEFSLDDEPLDLVVSNPPYISKYETPFLMKELHCEPKIALTDDNDGLTFYQIISQDALKYLRNGGIIAFEIAFNQAENVSKLLYENNYKDIQIIKDLAGKDRVVIATK
ncbi:protein-(glutamine-N5) methyltransferase, release factor-specific [Candidatus Epulonipiscium fishelsonii]|uniref:Protein-(Glutamine-N5) methyltransferase, release factor-specific n=1 Tax=Candidatus Epulonipiscium fishelsonii TaxID=77094 RepID=A0ACC8XJ12_9FIRM|nr:protein-(glutamine-N5) methyltransferase, release factor-specific [Epulopiscium sp. SCG-D08WGA-EpuloA1]